jgi:hypothetical protein
MRKYSRPYVLIGLDGVRRTVRLNEKPTAGQIEDGHAVGPFRTTRGARYLKMNPSCVTVSEAERKSLLS